MYNSVIFDMDGVMFDTESLAIEGWIYAGKKMGFNITKELILKCIGLNSKKTKQILAEALGSSFDYENCRAIRNKYSHNYFSKKGMPLKKGIKELLHYLKEKGIKIAVATSTSKAEAELNFEIAGILDYFDAYVCGDMIELGKPNPQIYLKAAQVLGEKPENCIAIEDSYMGIEAAHKAGMHVIMVPDLLPYNDMCKQFVSKKANDLLEVLELFEGGLLNEYYCY